MGTAMQFGHESQLGRTLNGLGLVHMSRKRYPLAIEAFQEAIQLKQAHAQRHPSVVDLQQDLAASLNNLGSACSEIKRLEEAEVAYRKAQAIYQGLHHKHPEETTYSVLLGGSYCSLGNVLQGRGDPRRAQGHFRQALEILEPLARDSPKDSGSNKAIRNTHLGLAGVYFSQKNYAEAVQECDLALRHDPGELTVRLQGVRAQCLLAQAAQEARQGKQVPLAALEGQFPQHLFQERGFLLDLAKVYAITAATVLQEAQTNPAERQQKARQHTDRALELLRQGKARGLLESPPMVEALKKSPDFQSLREYEGFQGLLDRERP
jgi:tetratricopeptide (TPR) repeat protein